MLPAVCVLFVAALPCVAAYGVPLVRAPAAARSALVRMQMPEQGAQFNSGETYNIMLSTLLKTEKSIKGEISANYAMVDYGFLQRLCAHARALVSAPPRGPLAATEISCGVPCACCSDEAIAKGGDDLERLTEIKAACNEEMAQRMNAAAEALREVLTSPTPVIMEGKIAGYARQGRIDDAMMQLLEANLQQAKAAGEQGAGAVSVMTKLQERVRTELDAKLPPPMALLRRLMRMNDPVARETLLREKVRRTPLPAV